MTGMVENEIVKVTVGLSRRVTLPDNLGLETGDAIQFKKTRSGFDVTVVKKDPYQDQSSIQGRKMRIYAVVLGRRLDDKFVGLYLDSNGIRIAVQISSTENYLKKDLSSVGPRAKKKFDSLYNGAWDFPTLVNGNEWISWGPSNLKQAIEKAYVDFSNGKFEN